MTDALLAEVAAHPDDDAPRRVFADRLLDAGDPWGELIHTQLDLAAKPDQREERALRQQELRAALLPRVKATFPDAVDRIEWHRGWIDRIRVSSKCFASHAPRIFEAAPLLRTIEFSDLDITTSSQFEGDFAPLLDRFAAALAVPEARRLEGLIASVHVMHTEWDETQRDWDGSPMASSTQYDLSDHALARILAADLPKLHMLELRRLSRPSLDRLASSPLAARLDHLRLELFEAADLRGYLDHPNVCALRGIACNDLVEHPKLAGLEELQVFDFEVATLWRLEKLRHFIGKPVAGLHPRVDSVNWFQARDDGRPNWRFHPTGEHRPPIT